MPPDLIADPAESLTALEKLYHSGAWIPLAILAAFYALTLLSREKWPWFQVGHRAAYVASALAGVAVLAVPASQGTTPNLAMVVAAIGAALTLWTSPTKPSKDAPSSSSKSSGPPPISGTIAVLAMLTFALSAFGGCATAAKDVKVMSGAFSACGKADLNQAVKTAGGEVVPVLTAVSNAITGNAATLESDLAAWAIVASLDTIQCAIVAVEAVVAPTPTATASMKEPPPGLLRAQAWLAQRGGVR